MPWSAIPRNLFHRVTGAPHGIAQVVMESKVTGAQVDDLALARRNRLGHRPDVLVRNIDDRPLHRLMGGAVDLTDNDLRP